MIQSWKYKRSVTGILRGSRRPTSVRVETHCLVDVPEVNASDIELALAFDCVRDGRHQRTELFAKPGGPNLLRASTDGGDLDYVLRMKLFSFVSPYNPDVPEMPDFREIIEDDGARCEAVLADFARRGAVVDGRYFFPEHEPYLGAFLVADSKKPRLFGREGYGLNGTAAFDGLRIDQVDEAQAALAVRGADADELEAEVRRYRASLIVNRPDLLRYTAERIGTIKAADTIYSEHLVNLGMLSDDEIAAWVELRTAYQPWRGNRDIDPLPLAPLAQALADTWPRLREHPKFTQKVRREIDAICAANATHELAPEDEEALAMAPSM